MFRPKIVNCILSVIDNDIGDSYYKFDTRVAYLFEKQNLVIDIDFYYNLVELKDLYNEDIDIDLLKRYIITNRNPDFLSGNSSKFYILLNNMVNRLFNIQKLIPYRLTTIKNSIKSLNLPKHFVYLLAQYDYYFFGQMDTILRQRFNNVAILPNGHAVCTLMDALYIFDLKSTAFFPLIELHPLNREEYIIAGKECFLRVFKDNIEVRNSITGEVNYSILISIENKKEITILPNGNIVILKDKFMKIFDDITGILILDLPIKEQSITSICAISNDLILLGSGDIGDNSKILNIKTGKIEVTLEDSDDLNNPIILGDFMVDKMDSVVIVWKLIDGRKIFNYTNYRDIASYLLLPNNQIAIALFSGKVKIFDLLERKKIKTIQMIKRSDHNYASCINILPDNRIILGRIDGRLEIIEDGKNNILQVDVGHSKTSSVKSINILPDRRIAVISSSNKITVLK